MTIKILVSVCFALLIFSCQKPESEQVIDLSGEWGFQVDSLAVGEAERWFDGGMNDIIKLPGSMAEHGKGNEVSVSTVWTGEIVDSAYYFSDKFEKYRTADNTKIPFWLQPTKHYIGVAWYQREIEIPKDWEGQSIVLFLERPHWETTVWVDGEEFGMQNSLGTPHEVKLGTNLSAGKHTVTVRVDNRVKEINPGLSAHSISDQTQTNWNGIVGKIELRAMPIVAIGNIRLFPEINAGNVSAVVDIHNGYPENMDYELTATVYSKEDRKQIGGQIVKSGTVKEQEKLEFVYPMGDDVQYWDEFDPNLYEIDVKLKTAFGEQTIQETFGMREFRSEGKQFAINGRPVFLRGTLDCAIFPLTGYPPTNKDDWEKIFDKIKDHGFNHIRFHSWCPPKAAFEAADKLGMYLQVEASSWTHNVKSGIGTGNPIDQWLYAEGEEILKAYGNHPSFVMLAHGNEPGGARQEEYLSEYVAHFQGLDHTKVYTGGSGWPYTPNADFYLHSDARLQLWGAGLNSRINSQAPNTLFDYNQLVGQFPMPYVTHEMGQWCAYPDFKEISKYTGVLKAKNFEIFQESLNDNNLGDLAEEFLKASGKLQALCYKADIEAGFRTKDYAGYQLLGLQDFSGQGTALVGVLNAFWEEKGYISPEEFKRFNDVTIPLVRLEKHIYHQNETLEAAIEVAHFGKYQLENVSANWNIKNKSGNSIAKGSFEHQIIPIGNYFPIGTVSHEFKELKTPEKLVLEVEIDGYINSWDIWVYPKTNKELDDKGDVYFTNKLDNSALEILNNGGKVLLSIPKGNLKPEKGGDIGLGFSSIFWNTAYTNNQKPHTLGIYCDPVHPVFAEFPTEYHSNWQWWDVISISNALVLDGLPTLTPLVRVIDDWNHNRSLSLLFEAQVGKGKLLVSSIDFNQKLDDKPASKQLLKSVTKYMNSEKFEPQVAVEVDLIRSLTID
ncbi:sugar-binding domain-containing protein [Belliella marina]|uniref:beta-galactosidase n=1 Tax=Belliella marina TaxID=1644146 RepID=A0ABW4VNL6_9BACT